MSGEIQIDHPTGANLYARVRDATGLAWNTATPGFEAFNATHWTNYAIALTERGSSGEYVGNFPAAAAGVYTVTVYLRAGGSPAVGDRSVGTGKIEWSGTAEVPLSTRSTFAGGAVASVTAPVTLPTPAPTGYGGPSIQPATGTVQASPTPTAMTFAISAVSTTTTPTNGAWIGQMCFRPRHGRAAIYHGPHGQWHGRQCHSHDHTG
jgi:hypothetical protein